MYKVLLVVYALKNPLRDYSIFYQTLQTATAWEHHIDNCWLIQTTESPIAWDAKLRPHMAPEDMILIIEVTRNYKGWLPNDAWDWIKKTIG